MVPRGDLARWHFGKKFVPGGKKKPFWVNRWLAHPCADLAYPFEVGVRAAMHHDACACPCHKTVQPGLVPCPRCDGTDRL